MSAPQGQGGLSLQTLIIASMSSLAAALFVHEFWQGGAIFAAAVTPVIVAIVSEALRKPVSRFDQLREERRERARRGRETFGPPPGVAPPREDRFGIWGEETPGGLFGGRLNARHLKIALATGLAAFVIAVAGLTALELVGGGDAGGDRRTTIFGGEDRDATRERRGTERPAATGTTPEPQTTPEEPEQPIEPGTVTEPPAETAPEQTAPAPEETVPAPVP